MAREPKERHASVEALARELRAFVETSQRGRALVNDSIVLSAPGARARCELAEYEGARGRRLRYAVVRARPERQALLYLHGIESHGGWFLAAAEGLAERGATTYLLDRRGSGLNLEPARRRAVRGGAARGRAALLCACQARAARASSGSPGAASWPSLPRSISPTDSARSCW
jgi:hypothetical protein